MGHLKRPLVLKLKYDMARFGGKGGDHYQAGSTANYVPLWSGLRTR